ncbi:hypothetical protein Glove_60g40 [Diversispora epigaea]|uniref:Uncharacterized protein n=1 Tax=Diversispora epigaea TaxID=1348612 RepID=A0A397JLG1_9GLOM|nr:hypothetical protein Glove_60g40 [Diversispora epigaea]
MNPLSNSKKPSFLQLLSKLLIPNESKPKLPELMVVKNIKLNTFEPRIKSFKNLLQTNFETLKASDLISQAFKKEKFKYTTLNFIKESVNLNSKWKSKNSALVTQMKKLEDELDTQKKELKTINAEFDLKNNELDVTIIKLISQNKKLEVKNLELDSRNQNLMATNAELVARIKELEAFNTKINDQKKEIEASNDDLNVRNLELEALNKELTTQTEDLESSNAELTARTTKLDDQKKELEASNYKLAAKTKELEASNIKLTSQNKEFEAANAQLAAQKDSTIELYAQIKKLKSFNAELAPRLKKMIASNSGLAANKKGLIVSNAELDTKINKVENLEKACLSHPIIEIETTQQSTSPIIKFKQTDGTDEFFGHSETICGWNNTLVLCEDNNNYNNHLCGQSDHEQLGKKNESDKIDDTLNEEKR